MKFENYLHQQKILPSEGKRIIANYGSDFVTVYQAFTNNIADYAIKYQKFGGNNYSFNRMTWIKPGFMWMMYRSGWATKLDQERILAIKVDKKGFYEILKSAIHSTFNPKLYETKEIWQSKLTTSNVRLQWDPDHAPNGEKLKRSAIQIGIQGSMLMNFNENWIKEIIDFTPIVVKQRPFIGNLEYLEVPFERELTLNREREVLETIGADWDCWNIYIEFKFGSEENLNNLKKFIVEIKKDKENEQLDSGSKKWNQYFLKPFWKLTENDFTWLIDCFASGEYDFVFCDRISEDTAKLICETWSAPYGGFEPFRNLIEGFGLEIIEEWD